MKTFELTPLNRKSFYRKAIVNEYHHNNETLSDLISYTTLVATYNHDTNEMRVKGWYSATTARHINAFLDLYGFDTCSKAELENYC